MPKLDIGSLPRHTGCGYPPPFDQPCRPRVRQRLGDAGGLTDFGVNLLELAPGAWSSQRHWHSAEDELVWVLEGEVTLVDDNGEQVLHAGDCAAFRKGDANGHHLVNRSGATVRCLEIGSQAGRRRLRISGRRSSHRPRPRRGLYPQGRFAVLVRPWGGHCPPMACTRRRVSALPLLQTSAGAGGRCPPCLIRRLAPNAESAPNAA